MLIADVTPEQILAFMTPFAVIIAAIINQIAAWKAAEAAQRAAAKAAEVKADLAVNQAKIDLKLESAADKAAEVKTDLAVNQRNNNEKLDAIKDTGEITHALVNARMGAVLKSVAEMSRRIADMTKFPEDIAAAEAAAEVSLDHEKKQRLADAK